MNKNIHGWIILLVTVFVIAGCGQIHPEPTATITLTITNTPYPTASTTPSITPSSTPSPTPTNTSTPTNTPTPIGESGLLVIEQFNELGVTDVGGVWHSTGKYESRGVYALSLRDAKWYQLFPPGYHLEGISPEHDRLLISEGNKLYISDPAGEDLSLLSEVFSHQPFSGKSAYWAPEIDRVFFLGTTYNRLRIFAVNPDGSNPITVANTSGKYVSIDTYANGILYWEHQTSMYWNQQTNLSTYETETIYWSFSDNTDFSPDRSTILDWQINYQSFDAVGHENWVDPMMIGIRDLPENTPLKNDYAQQFINKRNLEISLREMIDIEEIFNTVRINSGWWSPDNEHFLICVTKHVIPNIYTDCSYYYVLEINGQSIKELPYPEGNDLQYDNSIDDLVEVPKGLGHFTSNPWSPDGKILVFRDYDKIILHNLENDSNTEIDLIFSGPEAWSSVYWINNGDEYLVKIKDNSFNTDTGNANTGFQLNPEEQQYEQHVIDKITDNDLSITGWIDVIDAHYKIKENEFEFEVVLTLRDLPGELTFYRPGVCDSCSDYLWGVYIDIDNDINTGIPEWDGDRIGWEYMMVLTSPNNPEIQSVTLPIAEAVKGEIRQEMGAYSYKVIGDVTFNIDPDKNTITFSGFIPGINPESRIEFITFDFNPTMNPLYDYPE